METENAVQDKKLNRFSNVLLVLALALFIFGAGYRLGEYTVSRKSTVSVNPTPERQSPNMQLFWQVWDLIQAKYADQSKVKPKQMLYGAIKGLVASLEDPYSYFLTPEENQQSKDDLGGRYEGIGAELGMRDNRIIVVAPLENSPAKQAGVRSGDIIVAVDDQPTKGWTITQAVDKIRGEQGTTVKLTIIRVNKELEIKIKRQQIKVDSVKLRTLKKVAYLKVSHFGDNTVSEWDKAVSTVKSQWERQDIIGLVVDMRGNPGGYLDGAVYLASEFLPEGAVVVKQEYADRPAREYRVTRIGILSDIPLVVLINEGSASASEIFAGALRDHERAFLIGKKSFGKGSIQEALDLSGSTGLHLTIAKWVLPNGDWINSKGIEPSQTVELNLKEGNTLTDANDTQLLKAIEYLTKP